MQSDYWTQEQLEEAREDLYKPRTVGQMLHWLKEHEHFDLLNECSAIDQDWKYSTVAKVETFDVQSFANNMLESLKDVKSHNTTVSPSRQQSKEQKFLRNIGFLQETHAETYEPESILQPMLDNFDFTMYAMATQYQPPGCMLYRHVDYLDSMWTLFAKKGLDIMDVEYNPHTKAPVGWKAMRCMISLTDWVPGHVFGFDDQYWTDWKVGDVCAFNWGRARHYTANMSMVPRLYLKISGVVPEDQDHWLWDNFESGTISAI